MLMWRIVNDQPNIIIFDLLTILSIRDLAVWNAFQPALGTPKDSATLLPIAV